MFVRRLEGLPVRGACQPERHGRARREPGRDRHGLADSLGVGTQAIHQTTLVRRCRIQSLAEEGELHRPPEPDETWEKERGAPVGGQADVAKCLQEVGALGGDHEIAHQREAHAAPGGDAVDGGHERAVEVAEPPEQQVIGAIETEAEVELALGVEQVRAVTRGKIRSGAEPVAAAGQHDASNLIGARPDVVERRIEPGEQRRRECVMGFGAGHRHHRDLVENVELDGAGGF